jgi:preprotein translocase subunit Sec61beta
MARDNRVNMPMGQGGLTRYFDEYKSNIELKPGHVIILVVIIIIIEIFLFLRGNAILGLP